MSGGSELDHPRSHLQGLRRNTQSLPLKGAAPRVRTCGTERDPLANCTSRRPTAPAAIQPAASDPPATWSVANQ
ncbi:hypothetical protein J4Q44_G00058430 [Coregonus suidteri]|uniref:Uncharacterized protein n=1 Tax=Coregonus suidteri TaxID=861788 RepID=A0AAN8M606_9TELE